MNFFVIITGTIFTILSTSVLAYISIATMLGPWIAPTIVLCSSLLLQFTKKSIQTKRRDLILLQAMSSIGGVIAVAIGFSLPILYFLNAPFFLSLVKQKLFFCTLVSSTCLAAGTFGIVLGRFFENHLIIEEQLPFPVSQLTYKVITSQSQKTEARGLIYGIVSSVSLCILRDGIFSFNGILPKTISIFKDHISIALWPTLWAVGFSTGITTAIPLFIGMLSKYLVLYPLNYHSSFLPFSLFQPLKSESFLTAFCAGLVVSEIVLYLLQQPVVIKRYCIAFFEYIIANKNTLKALIKKPILAFSVEKNSMLFFEKIIKKIEPLIALCMYIAFFSYFGFSFIAQVFLFIAMVIALYQINYICGKIGLLQFGRYSSFLLIPMILIFNIDFLQITALCVFFNICAATSSDFLCDYKTAQNESIEKFKVHLAQWAGLLITTAIIGIIFYVLFNTFTLGADNFFAQRGRSKALLIQSLNFNGYVIGLGFLFGAFLKKIRISPTMTFGGILMPNHITTGFIIGGLCSYFAGNKKEALLPFCSGVFTSESLWILISLSLKIV